jgi:alpha-2-macroglobulin
MSLDGAEPGLPPESTRSGKPRLTDPLARVRRARRVTPGGRSTQRWIAVLAAAVLVATLGFVAGDSVSSPGSRDAGPSRSPEAAGVKTPSPSAPTQSSEPAEVWADLVPPPLEPAATLVASDVDRTGIAASSRFTLTSLNGTPAAVLAKGVTAVPPITFAITPGKDAGHAVLVPKSPLAAGVSYRLTLRTDASLAGSWLFQTKSPLHVASTLPGNQATGVPVNTGIEITFDQDGVGPLDRFFTIEPKVEGRLEQHARTWVFVPKQLSLSTIYTVTVRKGVTLAASDQVLEDDVVFSFETSGPQKASSDERPPLDASFPWKLVEVVPSERPLVEAFVDQPWGGDDARKPLSSLTLRVFRLPSLTAAVDAYRTLTRAPDWAESSDQRLVPTAGLPLVASFTAAIRAVARADDSDPPRYVEFPDLLDRGWYLVVRPRTGRDQQFVLQVTDVATYLTTTTTTSVLWVNDVSSGAPIEDATLWTAEGKAIATTGPDGTARPEVPVGDLFLVTAPDGGSPGEARSGRAAIVPLAVSAPSAGSCGYWNAGWGNDDYWQVLATDRRLYRPTDEIDAWGMVRLRDGGGVPDGVELRVSTYRYDCEETPAQNRALAIARVEVAPGGRTGTFATPIAIRDLPAGPYQVALWVGAARVASSYVEVGEIRKPSYTIGVSTDRHVLVEGDRFTATVTSAFFDGTPLPGLGLRLEGTDTSGRATTSANGEATLDLVASWPHDRDRGDWDLRGVEASPVRPEEGDTRTQSAGYVVFPARLLLDATAEVVGGVVRVGGDAHVLDQAGAEAQWTASAGTEWDPAGKPAAGAAIHVRVVDRWDVPVRTGRAYDFITKRAYDTFRYDRQERTIAEKDVVTGSDGTFALDVVRAMGGEASPKGHDYEVTLSARDADGRVVSASVYGHAAPGYLPRDVDQDGALRFDDAASDVALGAEIRRSLVWRGAPAPSGQPNRYLFLTAARGLRDVDVSSEPVYVHKFATQDLPNITIGAVWFTGRGYVVADQGWARVDLDTRQLAVTLTPDSARHAPGDPVRLGVRTVDRDGKPVSATVILRAIDEKLYAIDAAWEESPLEDLYADVPSGIVTTYTSHQLPGGQPRQGGATTGGGGGGGQVVRDQFRDSILFERVTTGADGRASVSFTASDDITSWRVSGAAFTADLRVGQSVAAVAVGLPFFIEAPLAPEYLAADRPTLGLRAYGSALRAGQSVTFTVKAPTLGMSSTTVRGPAFSNIAVALPALATGDHSIRIEASVVSASGTLRDILVRTIHVVDSRFTEARSEYIVLPAALPSIPTTGMAKFVFADAGRGRYLWPVRALAWGGGERVDETLAAEIARDVLVEAFGIDEDFSSGYPSYLYRYQKAPGDGEVGHGGQGIALLPCGSPEVALSARVSLLAGERFETWALAAYFGAIGDDPATTREQKNLALAGLAGVDYVDAPDVLAALGNPGLTVREQLYLALAAATLGDHGAALAVERSLLKAYGQTLGPWVRLRVGSTENDVLEATSLLALIAVTTGDPVADAAEAYVEEHFTSEDLFDLQKAAFLREAVERAPARPASFSFTIAGESRVVDLGPGETYALNLAPTQRATLAAKVLKGKVGVTVEWEQPVDPASIAVDRSLSLQRTVIPASPIPAGSVVTVVLTPRFGELTLTGCYRVVDLVPSGLAPLSWAWGGTHGSEDVTPVAISGQKVTFCASPWSARPPRLVYFARVVTPGEYAWEPALMQAVRGKESTALTASERILIR